MKIIQATHTTELAVNFGRKTKNLLETDEYKDIFPGTSLSVDSKASGRWDTKRGGMYYAVGVGSNLAGRGGDLIIIDDPHSEQTALSANGFDLAWDWYTVYGRPEAAVAAGWGHCAGPDAVVGKRHDGATHPRTGQGPSGGPVGDRGVARPDALGGAVLAGVLVQA